MGASRSTAESRRWNLSCARSSAARGSIASLRVRLTTAKRRSPISSCRESRIPLPASRISTSSSPISSLTFCIGPFASGQSNPTPAARSCSRYARKSGGREGGNPRRVPRSEEHTSELQSPCNLVCRLLLEKKKNTEIGADETSLVQYLHCLRH